MTRKGTEGFTCYLRPSTFKRLQEEKANRGTTYQHIIAEVIGCANDYIEKTGKLVFTGRSPANLSSKNFYFNLPMVYADMLRKMARREDVPLAHTIDRLLTQHFPTEPEAPKLAPAPEDQALYKSDTGWHPCQVVGTYNDRYVIRTQDGAFTDVDPELVQSVTPDFEKLRALLQKAQEADPSCLVSFLYDNHVRVQEAT